MLAVRVGDELQATLGAEEGRVADLFLDFAGVGLLRLGRGLRRRLKVGRRLRRMQSLVTPSQGKQIVRRSQSRRKLNLPMIMKQLLRVMLPQEKLFRLRNL